jgi:perosamine synthetase
MCEIFQKRRMIGRSEFPCTLARKEVLDYSRERHPGTFDGLDRTLVLPWNEKYTVTHVDYIVSCLEEVAGRTAEQL